MHINAIGLLAAGLGASIQPSRGTADDAKVFGVLEHHLLRNRCLHRFVRQLSVTELFTLRPDHLPRLRAQGLWVYTPALGS